MRMRRPARSGLCSGRGPCRSDRKVEGETKNGAAARPLAERDVAAHAADDPARDGEAEAGAAVAAGQRRIDLLELAEDALGRGDRHPGTAVGDGEFDARGIGTGAVAALGGERDAAGVGELDAVAGEVEEHLAEPGGIDDHHRRHRAAHAHRDIDALRMGTGGKKLDDVLQERFEIGRLGMQVETARLGPGEIEHVIDQRQQSLAGGVGAADIGLLVGRQPRLEEKPGQAEDAVERRAELVADGGEEARLRRVGGFRLPPGLALLAFMELPGAVGE